MIPAKNSVTSRHLSSTVLRHYARAMTSVSIIRTTGNRPTFLNTECIATNSNWKGYKRGYALESTSKHILLLFVTFMSKVWILQDTTRFRPHFDKILIANRYEILLNTKIQQALTINIEAKLLVASFVLRRSLGSRL